MSALAEALVAAQRRALSAMEKAYVAGRLDGDEVRLQLDAMGLSDDVDTDRLLVSLTVIRDLGAAPPAEPTPNGEPRKSEPASDAQLALVARLVKEKQAQPPDLPLTKADAHTIIDSLKDGSYNAERWTVPF